MSHKFILFLYSVPFITLAQVGINTNTPTRKLHVVGNMRVGVLTNKSESAAYDQILSTDINGNVDYITKSSMKPPLDPGTSNKESYSLLYNMPGPNGDPARTLKCGKFLFVFEGTDQSRINFRLAENPGTDVNIYMSMEQNFNANGFQFYQGKAPTDPSTVPFLFTTSNWNVNQEFARANLADYEQNIMHFQYPNDTDFYRLTIYKVKQNTGADSWDFVASCEKF
ncbi:hypothetical protein DRF59_00720 [Chryseobacterium flavum]|uniref:Uncharacterized protein n=1 Tax=Chryseobacterium flavum TaxID=415851 RepID=A0A3D9CUI2_9FLAO|nr:hypothetical protein [Chryseobacterium flavum]REC69425.1 hypothetical protein DRF59_00720 [Chryseobacterium flavum]